LAGIDEASAIASDAANQVVRQRAHRTMRPSVPTLAGSMVYWLAQDGQTMSMANRAEPRRSAGVDLLRIMVNSV
jgi:hypothetical protein